MHILLTDVLTCPRCGPEFGLIVLADRMDERRVVEGRLGCANCREEYPVRHGIADLRVGRAPERPVAAPREDAHEHADLDARAFRTAALLGIGQGTGVAGMIGASPELLERVASLLPNAQVVGGSVVEPSAAAGAGWVLHGSALPFRDRSLRGLALLDGPGEVALADAARTLSPGAHLVLDPASPEDVQAVTALELTVLLDQDGVMVASVPARG